MKTADVLTFMLLTVQTICLSTEVKIPKLILISMDGMRYNFLDNLNKGNISNFNFFKTGGVNVKYIRNVFPSVTYPNHMTIVTGLYPESHGIVSNSFWDPYLQDTFHEENYRQNFESKWFDMGSEPIWVTNYKAGQSRDSGVVLWPGGVAEMKSYMPRVIPGGYIYNLTYNWNKRVDHLIEWFSKNESNIRPINLGVLYFPEPDEVAHVHGPDSKEVKDIIYELDKTLGYLKKRLIDEHLFDDMNIIITSDHGHTDISTSQLIKIDQYVSKTLYIARVGLNSIVTCLNPSKDSTREELYAKLRKIPNITLYRKGGESSKALHYSDNRRISEFVLEAKKGYILKSTKQRGAHGFDPEKVPDMRPFFIAFGPAFKKGLKNADPFNSVDIYSLMCHILGIEPAPNNGTLKNVLHILSHPPSPHASTFQFTGVTFLVVVIFVAFVGGLYAIGACRQGRIKQYVQVNRKIINHSEFGQSSLLYGSNGEEEEDEF
ncbi:ectonucleotide pyrophosphatase/phosphodiesterase family member 5-like [Mytilus galloprovincialis]|uniref:ectonucleotide pyrophosphatase/phosphodiesterase family member 5-like n=1 Tax=Mytilus galloprovincialis TaxID=29158 RepID=UPI003F7BD390